MIKYAISILIILSIPMIHADTTFFDNSDEFFILGNQESQFETSETSPENSDFNNGNEQENLARRELMEESSEGNDDLEFSPDSPGIKTIHYVLFICIGLLSIILFLVVLKRRRFLLYGY